MIGRLLRITTWLLAGHVLVASLFWALLIVPESNVAMLLVSALLVVAILAAEAAVAAGAVGLAVDGGWLPRLARIGRGLPGALLAIVAYAAIRWLFVALTHAYAERTSELDAWFIARFDWTNTARLHSTVAWVLWGLGHVLAAAVGLAVLVRTVAGPAVTPARGVLARLAHLALIAVVLLVLVWLPWQAAVWRPDSLPVSVVQPIFAGAKLLAIAIAAHLGLALLVWRASSAVRPAPTQG